MTKKFTYLEKHAGDPLTHDEWNHLAQDVEAAVEEIINGGVGGGSSIVSATDVTESGDDDHKAAITITSGVTDVPATTVLELTEKDDKGVNVSLVGNNNINIEPREAIGDGSGKNKVSDSNRKGGNIALKPGDDIEFWAHHRGSSKNDEVSVKIMTEVPKASDPTKTDEVAAKLQLNTADIVLTSKDKQSESDEMNIVVNKDTDTRGYLKVRAQAIDLRCEDHGGIALQPKGEDGQGHMNKIKFEHGGGDGLEFGTFNTEKTSIFTDEYRFNKDGVWKMATRQTEASDKADVNDPTTALKYVKQLDDFYDIIDTNDAQCTTKDIIKTAAALNGHGCVHTHITSKGNLEIETSSKFNVRVIDSDSEVMGSYTEVSSLLAEGFYTAEELNTWLGSTVVSDSDSFHNIWVIASGESRYYEYEMVKVTPSINIESANKLKLTGELDFGSRFNFGETDNGIEVQNKYTEGTLKDCGKLKVVAVNNNSSAYTFNTLWDPTANSNAGGSVAETTVSVPAGETAQIAEASIYDIIKLVNYMKDNNQGPWANNL